MVNTGNFINNLIRQLITNVMSYIDVTAAGSAGGTDLCVHCGVIQGSLQGVAQTFREVLFQDQVQAVPTQLYGQHCEREIILKDISNLPQNISLVYIFDKSYFPNSILVGSNNDITSQCSDPPQSTTKLLRI